jgi:hypothetical protein
MNVIALNESMSLSDSHDGAFVNSDYLTDALEQQGGVSDGQLGCGSS